MNLYGEEVTEHMTLRDMEYIAAIAEDKSITRASTRLFVAQPALSQCVQKVEKELGVRIFLRESSGVRLTAEGQCYMEFIQKTLHEQKNLHKKLEDLRRADLGQIHLGFTGTQSTYVLPYFLPQFKEKYPNIDLTLVEASSEEIEKRLVKGDIEVGILHTPVLHRELDTFKISEDEMVIIPRSSSRFQKYIYYEEGEAVPYLDMEFLKDEPLVLTKSYQRSRMVCEQIFVKAGIAPFIRQECKSLNTVDALCQVDYGTALLPSKQISSSLKRRGYYKINPDYSVPYSFVVAVLRDTYLPLAAKKLLEVLHEIEGTF